MQAMTGRTRIKFCGITSVTDALAAVEAGVDAIGLIFAASSPRWVSSEQARRISESLPPFVTRVGLFRNSEVHEVEAVITSVELDLLQFHGDETPAYCAQFGRRWIKAVPMGALPSPDLLSKFLCAYNDASGFVFDSHGGQLQGGSGHCFDWNEIPQRVSKPVILAGGLTSSNVYSAIAQVHPFAVDVSSGIESAPGIKDRAKMHAFVNEVQRATHH